LGAYAYLFNRLTGIGLVVYLYVHLAVLSLLARGEASWNGFLAGAQGPFFTALDVSVLAGVLFHSLNGIRLVVTGVGAAVRWQRQLLLGLVALAVVLFLVAGLVWSLRG
jgi:succinate dehydrogenase / fumarate reductase, cytochrome b subunit